MKNFKTYFIPQPTRSLLLVLALWLASGRLQAQCGPVVSTFPYNEGFEAAAAWTSGGVNSSWAWGAPTHPSISSAGGGTNCWCTGGLTGSSYSGAQNAWIMSPCFDFTNLSYPYISFKIFWECEYIWDGMVLQYSTNGGGSWSNVGAFGDPVNCMNANWFNYSNISNLSASPKHGWCGRIGATSGSCQGGNGSGGWVTAKHCLSNLAGQPSVRFRFLFGTGTTCNAYDGIAVDDILIDNAPPNAANFNAICGAANTVNFTNTSLQCPTAFSWNFGDPGSGGANLSSTQNPTHVFSAPGTYTVSLTSSGPCNAPSTTLIPITILSLTTTATGISCFGAANASITSAVAGGAAPYTYTWFPGGQSTSSLSNIGAGSYTLNVSSPGTCLAKSVVTITQPLPVSVTSTVNNVKCYGNSTGSISFTTSGGTPGYTYSWAPVGGSGSSATGLAAGIYSITIKDANNCTTLRTLTVTQPASALNAVTSSTNVLCFNGGNGAGSVVASGGTPGYSYGWFPTGILTSTAGNLTPGTYSVTITDANSCTLTKSVGITQPATSVTAVTNATNILCYGAMTGAAQATASGGTPGYTYTWMPSGWSGSLITTQPAGLFTLTVKDANACTYSTTVLLSQPLLGITASISSTNISCYGFNNGAALVTAYGGIGNYTYSWTPTGATTPSISGLQPNAYLVTIKDANSCSITVGVPITQPLGPLTTSVAPTNVSCYGLTNGAATAITSGGTAPYTYVWTPTGGNAPLALNLSTGSYSVFVTDANSCTTTASGSITQPSAALTLAAGSNSVSCFGGNDGSATVTASGGTPGYSYSWSHGPFTVSTVGTLAVGIYTATVQDQNNCSASLAIAIIEPSPIFVNINNVTVCKNQPTSILAYVSGGMAPLSFAWNGAPPNSTNPITSTFSANTVYSVMVTDVKGCTSNIDTAYISIPPPLKIKVNPNFPVCQGNAAGLVATAEGGTGAYSFMWQPGNIPGATPYIAAVNSVNYTVSVSDGCMSTETATTDLVFFPVPFSTITKNDVGPCSPVCISFSNPPVNNSGLIQAYSWDFGDGSKPAQSATPQHCYEKPGYYSVAVTYTTVNYCVGSQKIDNFIQVNPSPIAAFDADKQSIDSYNTTVAFNNRSVGAKQIQWIFTPELTSQAMDTVITFMDREQFVMLTVSNEYGCRDTASLKIDFHAEFTFFAPNTFSPNNDNLNDVFSPKGINWDKDRYELSVYDRWGARLFGTTQVEEGWNGRVKNSGDVVQNGMYVWKIDLYDIFNKHHELMGNVLLEK